MNFLQIRSFDNYLDANIQLSMLKDNGINCHLKDEYTVTIDPLFSPAIGGMKLMVDESQAQRAIEIIEELDKEFLLTFACPHCGAYSIEKIEQITSPNGFWQKISFLLKNGQDKEVKHYYHCMTCNTNFDELPVNE